MALFVVAAGVLVFLFGPVLFASITYPLPQAYQASVAKWAQAYNINPNFLAALIYTESGWKPTARSGVGAIGMTQFIPSTAVSVAHQLGIQSFKPQDLIDNPDLAIRLGAFYISQDISRYGGDERKALIAYNGGGGAVFAYEAGFPIGGTVGYANKVLAIEKAYDAIYKDWWKNPAAPNSTGDQTSEQFNVKPQVDVGNVGSIPILDFWKTFIFSGTPQSDTSANNSSNLNGFWKNLIPGS